MFLMGSVGEDVVNSVRDFLTLVFKEFVALWYWPATFIGLMVLAIIVMFILINSSYERRILKSVDKLNAYFLSKPFITEENLVEFNLKMKKVPKVLRNAWQIYMLNREDGPSTYINANTCIDKPLRTSSIEKNISNFGVFTVFLTLLSFVAGLQYAIDYAGASGAGGILFYASLVPLGVVLLYTVFVLIMKIRKNDIYSCLYDNFPLYERNLTKAVSTLPSYVDYEILFTKKEIKEGIPILQQYLEKRALVEQQELEKARENSMACEEYDFNELGIDGSLVLERAMKECETFIKTRRRLQEECDQIETEKENYRKNFEITEKDFQRKLQASRENLESLKAQQEASTNRIESNYIKKQQGDEIKKQQQLEKDNEEATSKFNEEQVTLEQEIEKRKQEIEEKKGFVQQAMLLEFKHYANTLYNALAQKATEMSNQKLMALAQENTDLKALMTDLQGMTVDTPDVQDNLVQANDVAGKDLYEMSNADQSNLEEGREVSKENEKLETQKEEERKKAEKEKAEKEMSGETTPAEQEKPQAEETAVDATAGNETVENTTNADDTTLGGTEGDNGGDTTVDTGTNDDGGKQVDVQEETNEKPQEDDIEQINKQLEEETANLQKQKQEFETELNNTISKMDNVEDSPKDLEEPLTQEEPEVVEEPTEEEPAEEPVVERETRSVRPQRRGSVRAGTRSARTSRSSAQKPQRNVNSEIDALNAEMQKLLDSTKK